MTISVKNEDTLDTGASRRALASAAIALWHYAHTGEVMEDPPADMPWLGVVGVAVAIDVGSGEAGITVSVQELAAQLRNAHQRVVGVEVELPFEETEPKVQLAWEAVARFLAWGVQSGDALDQGLSNAMAGIGQWIDQQKARRGIA